MNVAKKISRKFLLRLIKNYCLHVLGYGEKAGISIYVVGCRALLVDNRARPEEYTPEEWCWQNSDYMLSKTKIKPRRKEMLKSQKVAAKANFDGKPSSDAVKNFIGSAAFLSSYEWRKVRMEALKKYTPKCMCCGATPATGAVMNVDHIKPRKLFPGLALELSNLQILCHECNHGKGNWDESDWRS